MKQILITLSLLTAVALPAFAQWDDDIYYNPKREHAKKEKKEKMAAAAAALPDSAMGRTDVDVDTYNMRGVFGSAVSPADTVGASAAAGQDFVYTNQIQKFYNPTIIVDNADVLEDVLNNSYGNVSIVMQNGVPIFDYAYASPYNWGWNFGWNYTNRFSPYWWGVNMGYVWAPGWIPGWGPAWAPGFDPFWSFGPAGWWRPNYSPGWTAHHYRPNGNQVNQGGRPNGGRPGGYTGYRPAYRPNSTTSQGRPGMLNNSSNRTYRNNPTWNTGSNRTSGVHTNRNYSSPANSNRSYRSNSSNSSFQNNNNSSNRSYQYRGNSQFGSGSRGSFGGNSRGGSIGGGSSRGGSFGGSHGGGRHR